LEIQTEDALGHARELFQHFIRFQAGQRRETVAMLGKEELIGGTEDLRGLPVDRRQRAAGGGPAVERCSRQMEGGLATHAYKDSWGRIPLWCACNAERLLHRNRSDQTDALDPVDSPGESGALNGRSGTEDEKGGGVRFPTGFVWVEGGRGEKDVGSVLFLFQGTYVRVGSLLGARDGGALRGVRYERESVVVRSW
jgi:hypothetical protein